MDYSALTFLLAYVRMRDWGEGVRLLKLERIMKIVFGKLMKKGIFV